MPSGKVSTVKENVDEAKAEFVKEDVTTEAPAQEAPATLRKLSIEFARTVSDGNYGSLSAKAYVQGEVEFSDDLTEAMRELGSLFSAAKVAIFDELGVAYHLDDEGVVREDEAAVTTARVAQALGGTQVSAPTTRTSYPFTIKNPDTASSEPIPDWAVEEIVAAGVASVFDNRNTKKGQQPWFKEAVKRGEMNVSGTTDSMDALGFWPPK